MALFTRLLVRYRPSSWASCRDHETLVLYCDYTASGRSLKFLEDYIQTEVLPDYGNTHTTTTVTSLQTTLFRHEARDIVRNAVNASEHDSVVFVGSGCTAAVHKVIQALHLSQPPVVLVGPFEHHSNLLPWRELGAAMVRISQTSEGLVDLKHLEDELKGLQGGDKQVIGCFAAASNVTGTLADVDAITVCLHKYGALAFWDYATAGPYVKVDMNPVITGEDQALVYKDAIFMSAHKFVGGVQTPGILVAKKKLFKNPVPSGAGGGSVFFVVHGIIGQVRRDAHRYLQEIEMREEGGTPAIVESVRAGLVFQLKEAVTADAIMQKELELTKRAIAAWSDVPTLVLLGSTVAPRLPIFSFLIRHPTTGLFLHHNFVCTVLNDIFGIQSRGGCACAGPYAQDLLGIDEQLAVRIEDLLVEDSRLDRVHLRRYKEYSEKEILRPGFTRLSLPYFMNDEAIDFVLAAVKMVADWGWKLLPQYIFNPETGEWRHRSHQVFKDRKWLGYICYHSGQMKYSDPPMPVKGPLPKDFQECLEKASEVFDRAAQGTVHLGDQRLLYEGEARELRWFLLPSEALQHLKGATGDAAQVHKLPFHPPRYPLTKEDLAKTCGLHDVTKILDKKAKSEGTTNAENSTEVTKEQETSSVDPSEKFQDGLKRHLQEGFVGSRSWDEDGETDAGSSASEEKLNLEQRRASGTKRILNLPKSSCSTLRMDSTVLDSPRSPVGHIACAVVEAGACDTNNSSLPATPPNPRGSPSETGSKFTFEAEGSETINGEVSLEDNSDQNSEGQKKEETEDNNSEKTSPKKAKLRKWQVPPKEIFKPFLEALQEYEMIKNGDRVLVCLSGGKDSLSLLHAIKQYQFYARKQGIEFEMGAVTVDPQTPSYDPSPLKGYLQSLDTPYFYESQPIMDTAASLEDGCASICSFCSRMKRGRIYHSARREGYNVLALGQHLDDLAESFMMSVFHNGILRTMKAHYTVEEGDLRVIRPFVFVREKDTRKFAEQCHLPVIAENCPACFEAPKERHRIKQLLATQEVLYPRLYPSILAAMKPIMAINKTQVNIKQAMAEATGSLTVETKDDSDSNL